VNTILAFFINRHMPVYDRKKAVEYAYKWWNKRNPEFYNFDKIGGDCTNFISQCLLGGGIEMYPTENGWHYFSLSNRSPAWSGVNEFYSFLITNKAEKGIKGRLCEEKELEIGDVVQMDLGRGVFHHNLLVTSIKNGKIFIACHSADAFDKSIDDYRFTRIRFLKILN